MDNAAIEDKLDRYRAKRNFDLTPEPLESRPRKGAALSFVVQKHAATRLHYDFRLELDGVLLSWAVPKGPSYDPADKRMAVRTEDHPLSYASFEGEIPKGAYGAGHVIVWDRGSWTPLSDPHQGLANGKLAFELHGEKLRGAWELIRIKSPREARQEPWILFKRRDENARPSAEYDVVTALPESVLGTAPAAAAGVARAAAAGVARAAAKAAAAAAGRTAVVAGQSAADAGVSETAKKAGVSGSKRLPGNAANKDSSKRPQISREQAARKEAAGKDPAGDNEPAIPGVNATLPDSFSPQLATLASEVPAHGEWIYEIKFDGYRVLARRQRLDCQDAAAGQRACPLEAAAGMDRWRSRGAGRARRAGLQRLAERL